MELIGLLVSPRRRAIQLAVGVQIFGADRVIELLMIELNLAVSDAPLGKPLRCGGCSISKAITPSSQRGV
jgi:hypothetical protein